jgi:hypothetical protein
MAGDRPRFGGSSGRDRRRSAQAERRRASWPRRPALLPPKLDDGLILNPGGCLEGLAAEAERIPRAGRELVGAGVAVAGVDGVIAARFAHPQPQEIAGRGSVGRRGTRRDASEAGERYRRRQRAELAEKLGGLTRSAGIWAQASLRQRVTFPNAYEVSCRVRTGWIFSPAVSRLCDHKREAASPQGHSGTPSQ